MALRPVSEPTTQDGDEEGPSELDSVAKLIARESPFEVRRPAPPLTMIEPARPAEQVPTFTEAGWYPDDADATLMRYWDGHHLTGQTLQVDPVLTDDQDAPASDTPQANVDEDGSPGPQTWTTLRSDVDALPADASTAPPQKIELPPRSNTPTESAGEPAPIKAVDGPALTERAEEPAPIKAVDGPAPREMPDHWAEKASRAVSRARALGTPDAWREVVSVVAVVSELAQTMLIAAGATQVSEEADRLADQARDDAAAAEQAATAARQASQEAADNAQQTQDAAMAAARAAADAMRMCQQAEQEAPQVAEVAETAARTAAEARAKLEDIEAVVARAQAADTPDAWAEANRLAAAALRP